MLKRFLYAKEYNDILLVDEPNFNRYNFDLYLPIFFMDWISYQQRVPVGSMEDVSGY